MNLQEHKDELRTFIEALIAHLGKFKSAGLAALKKGGKVVHQAPKRSGWCGPAGKALAAAGGPKVKC